MSEKPYDTPPCPICGARATPAFGDYALPISPGGRLFRYAACDRCRALFCAPLPTDAEIAEVYSSVYSYSWFRRRRFLKRIQARHRHARVRALFRQLQFDWSPGRILDVGCGHGWFLREAARRGWEAWGVDYLQDSPPDEQSHANIRLIHGSLLTATLPEDSFDVITLWHALEHMTDPRAALARAAALLKPGGCCVIAVPNRNAAALAKSGLQWGWLQQPFVHLFCFSAEALRLAAPAGMELVHAGSRDTWDQQYAMSTASYRLARQVLRVLLLGPRRIANRLGSKKAVAIFQGAFDKAIDAVDVAAYSIYLLLRPLLRGYERGLKACELLVVLRKKSAGDPPTQAS